MKFYEINDDLDYRAFRANHMGEYKGNMSKTEYMESVKECYELAEKQKEQVDEKYHEKIDYLADLYSKKFADWINRKNSNSASCPSILVAGWAAVDPKQKERQNKREGKLWDEYKEIQTIPDKIGTIGVYDEYFIRSDDDDAVMKLKVRLSDLEKAHDAMKKSNLYYKRNGTLKGCPFAENWEQIEARMKEYGMTRPYSTYTLQLSSQKMRQTKDRIRELEQIESEELTGWSFDGGVLEFDKGDNRIKLYFDEKPSDEVRKILKSNAFKWSPKKSVWQRQLTENAINAVKRMDLLKKID